MKMYEAPQAQVVNFDNDYVATSSRSRVATYYGTCESGDQTFLLQDGYYCGPYSTGGDR